jgi:hypothetical protein
MASQQLLHATIPLHCTTALCRCGAGGGHPPSATSAWIFDLTAPLLPPGCDAAAAGDVFTVTGFLLGGQPLHVLPAAAAGGLRLPAPVLLADTTGLIAPQSIVFEHDMPSLHRLYTAYVPCVSREGLLFAPPLDNFVAAGGTVFYHSMLQRDAVTVYGAEGERLGSIPWAALGAKPPRGDAPLISAYDNASRTLFLVDQEQAALYAISDAAGRSMHVKWCTRPGRLVGCVGIAVCAAKGVVLTLSHASVNAPPIELYRIADGKRVLLLDDGCPALPFPKALAYDAANGLVVVACLDDALLRDTIVTLRWQKDDWAHGFRLIVADVLHETAWLGVDPPLLLRGVRMTTPVALAVVPPAAKGGSAHIIIGRGNELCVHALPRLQPVQYCAFPEGKLVVGLAGDPLGCALVVLLRNVQPGPAAVSRRMMLLHVLDWPIAPVAAAALLTDPAGSIRPEADPERDPGPIPASELDAAPAVPAPEPVDGQVPQTTGASEPVAAADASEPVAAADDASEPVAAADASEPAAAAGASEPAADALPLPLERRAFQRMGYGRSISAVFTDSLRDFHFPE